MAIPKITDPAKSFERLNAEITRISHLCKTPSQRNVLYSMSEQSKWLEASFIMPHTEHPHEHIIKNNISTNIDINEIPELPGRWTPDEPSEFIPPAPPVTPRR